MFRISHPGIVDRSLSIDPPKVGDAGAIDSPSELFDTLHKELTEVERRLTLAEIAFNKKA